jgi:predicted AlkP superfamily phosphohydrolase/phosphomutase
MMTENKSLLVIGLDGATWKVLDVLIKKGKLPFISRLKFEGASGILESTIPPITAPAWTSFQTGVNPGKHGVFGFLRHRQDFSNPPLVNSETIAVPKIWEVLGKNRKKSLLINMPVTYPVKKINGVVVSSFLTPMSAVKIYPKKLEKILEEEDYEIDLFSKNASGDMPQKKLSMAQKKHYLNRLLEISEKRVEVFKKLFKMENFPFSFILFKETDIAQHLFWNSELLSGYYSRLDKLLENLYQFYMKATNGIGNTMIVSDHGFHKTSKYEFSPNVWLSNSNADNLDNVMPKTWNLVKKIGKYLKKQGLNLSDVGFFKNMRDAIVGRYENKARKKNNQSEVVVAIEGLYFVNKKAKSDLIILRNKLRQLLYKNKKVFKTVELARDVYTGNCVQNGPDIAWITNEGFSINTSLLADRVFNARITHIKGDHISDRDGVFIAVGAFFKKVKKEKLKIYDIFPLICCFFGISIPANVDGQVPFSILRMKHDKINSLEKRKVGNQISKEIASLLK